MLCRLSKDKAAIGYTYEDSTPAAEVQPEPEEEEEEEEQDILSDDEVDLGKKSHCSVCVWI